MDLTEQEFEISFKENKINLNINYEIRKKKIEKVLVLNPEEFKIENIVTNLCVEIDILKKENQKQSEEIIELKKIIEELKKI